MLIKILFLVFLTSAVNCTTTQTTGKTTETPIGTTETPRNSAADMARHIIQNSDWLSIATISTQNETKGYPFVALKSYSDGSPLNSTGIPYLYLNDMDIAAIDLNQDNRCTILASLAESHYCEEHNLDPQNPLCGKVMISGRLIKLNETTDEYEFGKSALFEKHPEMATWPADHAFYVAKIDIEQIELIAFFGGAQHVPVEDYFRGNVNNSERNVAGIAMTLIALFTLNNVF